MHACSEPPPFPYLREPTDPLAQAHWPLVTPAPDVSVILLSFFDGVGAARFALHTLGVRVTHYISWETDKRCVDLLRHRWPDIDARGDIYDEKDYCDEIQRAVDAAPSPA